MFELAAMQQAIPPAFEGCEASQALECLQVHILNIADRWIGASLSWASKIFASLVLVEIVVTGYSLWTKTGGWGEMLQHMATKLCVMAILLAALTVASTHGGTLLRWPPATAAEFAPSAVKIEGVDWSSPGADLGNVGAAGTTVTALIGQGLRLFNKIVYQVAARPLGMVGSLTGMVLPGSNLVAAALTSPAAALMLIAAVVVLGTFLRLAVELFGALVEAYIAMAAGAVFLGFMAFRGTAPLTEGWVRYMVSVCVKIFFLFSIAAFAMTIGNELVAIYGVADGWLAQMVDPQDPDEVVVSLAPAIALLAVCMLIWGLCRLPDRIAQVITQNLSVNIKGWMSKT